jgi:hypothetical protein
MELDLELNLNKKSKVWSGKIKVVMCVNKMAHP